MAVLEGGEQEEGGGAEVGGVAVGRRPEHEKPRHCQAKLLELSGMAGSRGGALLVPAPGSRWVGRAALECGEGKEAEGVWWTGSTDCGVGRGGVAGVGDSSGAVDLAPRRAPGKLRKR